MKDDDKNWKFEEVETCPNYVSTKSQVGFSAKDEQWAAKRPTASPKTHRNGCDVRVQNLMTATGRRILSPPPNFEKYVRYETLQGIIGSRMEFVAWWHVSRIFKSLGSNVSCCSNKICGGKNYGLTQKLRGLCCICLTRNSSTDTFSLSTYTKYAQSLKGWQLS